MRETGRIIAIDREKVSLILETDASCGSCGLQTPDDGVTGCTACTMFQGERLRTISAVNRNHLPLKVGDRVVVFLRPGKAVFAAFLFFILPLLLFIGGYGIAAAVSPSLTELGRVLIGFGGFGSAYAAVILLRAMRKTRDWPEVVAREEPGDETTIAPLRKKSEVHSTS